MTDRATQGVCAWCGLPAGGTAWQIRSRPAGEPADQAGTGSERASGGSVEEEYCCFGCRFAARVTQDRGESGQVQWTLTRLGLSIFFTMAVMVFTMALWSRDVYGAEELGVVGDSLTELFRWLCLIGALPVLFLLGVPVAASAGVDLMRGRVTSDLLVAGGVSAAFAFSAVSLLRGTGAVYFEVPCMVLVLVTLGRWVEARDRVRAGRLLDSLDRLLPETARRICNGRETTVATDELRSGDTVRVLCGERIPADGVLISAGEVLIDQQILTGESDAVVRRTGAGVFSGTVPLDSEITLHVTRPAQHGTLAQILKSVQTVRRQRGRYQRLADRATSWFVPLVALLAAAAFVLNGGTGDIGRGLLAALAVTLIACPCALGLATSMAVWTALQRAAGRGVLIRSGEVLETLAAIRAVRFDKTGTLTTGRPTVDALLPAETGSEAIVQDVAVAMAERSSHAFSRAIADWVRRNDDPSRSRPVPEFSVRTLPGLGLEAELDLPLSASGTSSTRVWLGSRRLLQSRNCRITEALDRQLTERENNGLSVVLIGWDGQVRGAFVLRETSRPEAAFALSACQHLGLDVGILSGDRQNRVEQFGRQCGVPAVGGLLPADKLAILKEARSRFGPVLMVGDGINDGPALAGADVAASLAGGTDLSRDVSGVCLLRDELAGVPWVIALGRQTQRIIRQNLCWAFGYNAVGMLLAVAGLLNPVIAAGLMFLSSGIVLGNSRRLAVFPLNLHSGPSSRSSTQPPDSSQPPDSLPAPDAVPPSDTAPLSALAPSAVCVEPSRPERNCSATGSVPVEHGRTARRDSENDPGTAIGAGAQPAPEPDTDSDSKTDSGSLHREPRDQKQAAVDPLPQEAAP